MILSNNGIIQSGKSLGGGGGVDPFAANVALFLKGNDTNNTNIVDNSNFVSNFEPFAGSKKTIDSLIKITESATSGVSGIIGNYRTVAVNGRWRVGYTTSSLLIPNPTISLHFTWTIGTGSQNDLVFTKPYVDGFNHLAVCVDSTIPQATIIYLCINGVVGAFNNNNFESQTTLFDATYYWRGHGFHN